MRPRKLILFITRDEQTLSLTSYVLRMHYRVIASNTPRQGLRMLELTDPDLLITDSDSVVKQAKRLRRWMPVLGFGAAVYGDQSVTLKADELLPLVKLMSARKRGPKRVEERKAA